MAAAQSIRYAGFWRRLLAFLIDSILYSFLLIPILIALYGRDYFYWSAAQSSFFSVYGFADLLLTKLFGLGLLVAFWVKLGATPGKLLLDCRVVDANTFQPISWKQALFRLFGYGVSYLTVFIGFAWMGIDKRKQGLHDKIATTVVLHLPSDYSSASLDDLMATFR